MLTSTAEQVTLMKDMMISRNERLRNAMITLSRKSRVVPPSLFLRIDLPAVSSTPPRGGTYSGIYPQEYLQKRIALKRLYMNFWEHEEQQRRVRGWLYKSTL